MLLKVFHLGKFPKSSLKLVCSFELNVAGFLIASLRDPYFNSFYI